MSKLKIGFGEAEIRLEGGKISLFGQWEERLTNEVLDPLFAVAMIVETDAARTVFVGLDICEPSDKLSNRVAEMLTDALPGFSREQLLLNATHIHTGPCVDEEPFTTLLGPEMPKEGVIGAPSAREQVARAAVKAVLDADAALEDGFFEVSVGYAQTGICRRVRYKDGRAKMYGDAHTPEFAGMEGRDGGPSQFLYARKLDGALMGVVANVPCTAQCDESALYVTADYFGVARPLVREALGENVKLLGLVRAAGDLSPHPIADDFPGAGPRYGHEVSVRMGKRVAKMIVDQASEPLYKLEAGLEHANERVEVDFPVWLPTDAEYEAAKKYLSEYKEEDLHNGLGNLMDYSNAFASVKRREMGVKTVRGGISGVRLGPVAFVTFPFELYIEYADRVRMACPFAHVFDVELSDDCLGYLPTRLAVAGGHYSAVILSAATPPEGGELLVEKSVALIRGLFGK